MQNSKAALHTGHWLPGSLAIHDGAGLENFAARDRQAESNGQPYERITVFHVSTPLHGLPGHKHSGHPSLADESTPRAAL